MERVYRVIDKTSDYYILRCASYGFLDDEEIMSATNDVVCSDEYNLLIDKYVKFDNEVIEKINDKYVVSGLPTIYQNDISDNDIKEYDKEFELSIKAYIENDSVGIEKWNNYLKTYEDKFMNFKRVEL